MSQPTGTIRYWRGQGAINAGTAVDLHTPKSATTSVVFVTKCTVSITAHANGKLVQFQDSAGSPIVFAKRVDLTAAAGVPDSYTWDFGTIQQSDGGPLGGFQLTTGKKCQGISESSGPTGYFYAEGYEVFPNPTSN
jgi:hypothetical protein